MKSGLGRHSLADTLILGLIGWYQRRISPRKGYRCAHSVLHGGAGCSGAVKSAIEQHGWRKAQVLARERFRQCQLAGQMLRAQNGSNANADAGRKSRKSGSWADGCCEPNWCLCFDALVDCGPLDGGCIDCTPCDCTPCS